MINNNIVTASEIAGKCQRNWLDEPIDEFDLETIISSCMNMPTKQNVTMYELLVVRDKNTIDFLYDTSYVPELDIDVEGRWRNAQMKAPTVLMWYLSSQIKYEIPREDYSQGIRNFSTTNFDNIKLNAGISMGAAALTATQLGYHVGFNCCGDNDEWVKLIQQKNPEIEGFICALGIGKPIENLPRNIIPTNKNISNDLVVPTEDHRKERIVHYI